MHPLFGAGSRSRSFARTLALLAVVALLASLFPAMVSAAPRGERQAVIVVFDDSVTDPGALAAQLGGAHGFQPKHVYRHTIKGFAATMSPAAAQALSANPRVAWVEPDGMAYPITTQGGATWGLDRIDQRAGTNGTYNYTQTGAGVTAYVIDTGIEIGHDEFAKRATYGYDFYNGDEIADDCNGHGTHVAGTIGGTTYGVAKQVSLIAVQVFGCDGGSAWSTIIAGVDWVTAHHTTGAAVANMSLGGPASSSVDEAVRRSIDDGISYAIAAGNGNFIGRQDDACKYSPARVTEAMTISATNSSDDKPSWANYGPCVDWFAPGVSITSAWHTSNTATNTISGTSMATPHAAGVAALCLDATPTLSPAQVHSALASATTKGVVDDDRTANNDLLYSLVDEQCGGGGASDPDDWPTVSITSPGEGATVSGTLTITATASDDVGVSQVEFFVDGESIGLGSSSEAGWSIGWNTTTYSNEDHRLTARATDSANQSTTSDAVNVTVSNTSSGSGLSLSANGYKSRGFNTVDLSWTGANGGSVDVWRGTTKLATTTDAFYTDSTGDRGGATYSYSICEAGTSTCSNTVDVTF